MIILSGRTTSVNEEVMEAAKAAYAHKFIAKLQKGYDSMVGERGVKLSGGQHQRIAIARTFLKDAPILILDEATAQLDSVTENYIQESLLELMNNFSCCASPLYPYAYGPYFSLQKREHYCEDCPHQELLALNGHYKTLWDAQVGGFLPEKAV